MNDIYKFLKSEWCFKKIKKKNILIYDFQSVDLASLIFDLKNCEILHVRFEKINLRNLFYTVFKDGLKNLKQNYKINYIKSVDPKVIFSTFTWNLSFFKLKNYLSDLSKIFICVQIGNVDKKIFRECKNYYNNNSLKLEIDYFFVLGRYYEIKFSSFIKSKFYTIGSFKNNMFYIKKIKDVKKMNSILFISQIKAYNDSQIDLKYRVKIDNEVKILRALEAYCIKKKYTLKICARSKKSMSYFYDKQFGLGKWKILFKKNVSTSYNLVNNSYFIVGTNSTLGLEALSKGIRCIFFPPEKFPVEDFIKNFKKKGPFWSEVFSEKILESYINRVVNYKYLFWRKIMNDNLGKFIFYNPKNSIFFKIMKKENIKTLQ
jgi:surface carbohydrate biosynthesis protein